MPFLQEIIHRLEVGGGMRFVRMGLSVLVLIMVVVGGRWLPAVSVVFRALLGAAIVALGIAGDLFESMLKRSAGVKDSSSLIPGHGGILDRIDALLFAAPVYYVVLRFT